jgi:hypothetical protein
MSAIFLILESVTAGNRKSYLVVRFTSLHDRCVEISPIMTWERLPDAYADCVQQVRRCWRAGMIASFEGVIAN